MKKVLAIVLLTVFFVGAELQAQDAAKPELRTWKDSTGQFSVEAVFVRVSGDQVVLQGADKKEVVLLLARLSVADRKYVQNIREVNSIGMKLKLIPAGEFQMGSPEAEQGRFNGETRHG
ncbi:MAG: SHD1 domain-containing protein, partial [Opitutales bacterium]